MCTRRIEPNRGDDNRESRNAADPAALTSPSVLMGARVGDDACWNRLIGLYGPLVYQWCRNANWGEHDAADLVQETFQVVHRKLPDFRRDRPGDSFRGWLRTIATNKMRDRWRRKKRQAIARGGSQTLNYLGQLPDSGTEPPDGTIPKKNREEMDWLYHRALELVRSEFDARTWKAFWSVVVEERAPNDVAQDLAISRNAVYIAKSRILSRLRCEFSEVID